MSQDGGRARRRTTKAVNYAKEQDFSDDDVFEDEDEDDKPNSVKKRGRPRKSTGIVEVEDDFGGPPKPVYTEKGYDPNVLPLRERFPFLPEYEADGSPRIELIVGRRPIVEKEKAVENLEEDPDLVDEAAAAAGGAGQRAARRRTTEPPAAKKGKVASPPKKGKKDAAAVVNDETAEYEYLIKYKGKSYLHMNYKTGHDLESMNKSAKTLYRRFLKKLAAGTEEGLEDPEFDASFAQPQKIVDEAEQEVTVELTDKELIAWENEREKEMEDEDDEDDPKIEGADDIEEAAKKEEEAKEEEAKKEEQGTC
jgi:hypothetical protein